MHLGVEVTESSTNKQHHLSVLIIAVPIVLQETTFIIVCSRGETNFFFWPDPIAGYPKFTFCHGVRIRANLAAEESLGPRNSARDFERCDISRFCARVLQKEDLLHIENVSGGSHSVKSHTLNMDFRGAGPVTKRLFTDTGESV